MIHIGKSKDDKHALIQKKPLKNIKSLEDENQDLKKQLEHRNTELKHNLDRLEVFNDIIL